VLQNRKMNPETIAPPMGHYCHAMEIGEGSRVMYVSGQVGAAPDGTVPSDFRAQAENAWNNCERILEFNGMRIKDVVKVNHYLLRAADIPTYNEVRVKHLGTAQPASTLVIVAALFKPEFLVEVEMVAAIAGDFGSR
jgi:enamine deaminase RidA (YjgF/YER057c/UK114 family)